MKLEEIQQLVDGAFKYGPFFFSILFCISLFRWSYRRYIEAVTRSPKLDPPDLLVNRSVVLVTFFFGIALVIVSIVWWWWFKPSTYYFRGEIENLQPQEEIAADSYYLREEMRAAIAEGGDSLLRNEHFLIIQAHPFRPGDRFPLDYAKNHQRRVQLWINYADSEEEPKYTIDYDSDKQIFFLKPEANESEKQKASVVAKDRIGVVYAAERTGETVSPDQPRSNASVDPKLITILQDSHSDVATKLNAIDILNSSSASTLHDYLATSSKEPFALTLFDLTQHSDPELASKATTLSKRMDIDSYLVSRLSSDSQDVRVSAETILFRISRIHALALLGRTDIAKYPDLRQAKDKINSGQYTKILKPTASLQGDRYYIRATWNPAQAATLACLTKLFNTSLETSRTFAQEQALMSGKSQRYAYWYDKQWALDMSAYIKQCGGESEFVHPY